jgi:hypothetical protein
MMLHHNQIFELQSMSSFILLSIDSFENAADHFSLFQCSSINSNPTTPMSIIVRHITFSLLTGSPKNKMPITETMAVPKAAQI